MIEEVVANILGPLSPGPFSFSTPHRRGGGGRWTSLHESTSVCHAQTLPLTYSPLSLSHFHTHTHKHKTTILHYPSSQAQEHFFCTLHTSSTRSLFTFLLDTDTVKIIALCTIGSDPFLYLETLCVKMFSLCVCICDLCMDVSEVYKCICVCVYVYKLLDDLNFPRD